MSERNTPDYIDTIALGTTMDQVFGDLYARGDIVAQALEAQARAGEIHIPGTLLELGSGYSNDNDDGMATESRTISVGDYPQLKNLYYLAEEGPAGVSPERELSWPSAIAAYRGDALFWRTHDLHRFADGRVMSVIGSILPSFRDEEPDVATQEEPYVGNSMHDGKEAVAKLNEHEQQRLRIITNAITLGIARTEMLRDGADFYKMFDIKPKPDYRKPSSRFSLRRLLGDAQLA